MSQAVITLIILAVAIVLFVSDKLPMGLVCVYGAGSTLLYWNY